MPCQTLMMSINTWSISNRVKVLKKRNKDDDDAKDVDRQQDSVDSDSESSEAVREAQKDLYNQMRNNNLLNNQKAGGSSNQAINQNQ